MNAAGSPGRGIALVPRATGHATSAPEKPYMIVRDASNSTSVVSYGPKWA